MKITEATPEEEIAATKVDLHDRDPKHINKGLKVSFLDIFAEPDPSVYSIDCVWTNAFAVFEYTKLWVYRILSVICGLPIAFCCGCCFACCSFSIIWCTRPYLRLFSLSCTFIGNIFKTIVNLTVRPLTVAFGGCLSTIRIHHSNGDPIEEEPFIV